MTQYYCIVLTDKEEFIIQVIPPPPPPPEPLEVDVSHDFLISNNALLINYHLRLAAVAVVPP